MMNPWSGLEVPVTADTPATGSIVYTAIAPTYCTPLYCTTLHSFLHFTTPIAMYITTLQFQSVKFSALPPELMTLLLSCAAFGRVSFDLSAL